MTPEQTVENTPAPQFQEPPKVIEGTPDTAELDSVISKTENKPTEVKVTQPLYRGLKESYDTVEALADYTRQLERDVLEKDAKLAALVPTPAAETPAPAVKTEVVPAGTDLQTRILLDPESVLKTVKEDAKREFQEMQDAQVAEKTKNDKFWSDFYTQHADLKEDSELVQFVLARDTEELKALPLNQATEELAKRTRAYFQKVFEGREKKELLTNSRIPETGGTIQGTVPSPAPKHVGKNMSDQMRQIFGPKLGLQA